MRVCAFFFGALCMMRSVYTVRWLTELLLLSLLLSGIWRDMGGEALPWPVRFCSLFKTGLISRLILFG